MAALTNGDQVANYRIERLLGRGGMGIVYLARDVQLGRRVALKVLAPELAVDQSLVRRFLQEAQFASQVEHPNIVPVYDAGIDGDRLFLAMRYIEGSDLRDVLLREGALEPGRTIALLAQAARALDAAHAHNLVHRDVKPANVLVAAPRPGDPAEHVYLTDFGLARQTSRPSDLSVVGSFVGTVVYCPPEQLRGGPVGASADIYSLGCVLYQCLTGRVPFPGTEAGVMLGHLELPPPRPSDADTALAAFDAVVERAMAKDPGDRYRAATELIAAARSASSATPEPGGTDRTVDQPPSSVGDLSRGASTVVDARERKVVSVLFCDLVGFTAASESEDPEDVGARLAPYHARVRRVIESYGGVVEKFIGDAVMAVFGAPVAHEDDAERAVRAGLSVLETIEALNTDEPSCAWSVRIGVNTGEVIATLTARPDRGEGSVVGDVVNTAARIQARAPVDGVAVGAATYHATSRIFHYTPLAPIAAKGKVEPVPAWQAVAPVARFGSDVIRSTTGALVGRDLELRQISTIFDRVARERAPQMVTIVGEPGVGKSRLVAELFGYVDGLNLLATWRQGRCPAYGDGVAFWAFGEIVKAHAGIYDTDDPAAAAEKLDAILPDTDDRPWLRARLLPLIGIESSEASQEEAFTAWRRFVESIAERDPFVLVIEDVHWADDALLSFLEYLADWATNVPLLIVCTARPELYHQHPSWAGGLVCTTKIQLARLSDLEMAKLVGALLQHAVLPPGTQRLLIERAGGNPLYAGEFVRMLRDRDLLDTGGQLVEGADVRVPDSIQALVAARLDTLPPDAKQLLQDAAVIGKTFWAGAVIALGDRDPRAVEIVLHELARMELVRPSRQSSIEHDREYGFWHALVRDVAYNQIPRLKRAARHFRAAQWLERKAGDRIEDLAEVLAFHAGEALTLARTAGDAALAHEIAPVAARFALLAGERAIGLDMDRALVLLDRARALTPMDDPAYPIVLLRWADAARQAARLPAAAEALEEAVARFEEHGDPVRAGEALSLMSSVRHRLGEADTKLSVRAVAVLEPYPGPELVAALAQLAGTEILRGEHSASIAAADRALTLADQLGLSLPARALGFRGLARCYEGDLEGLNETHRALGLLIAEGRSRDAAVLQTNIAGLRGYLEGPAAALAGLEEAGSFATHHGLTAVAEETAVATLWSLLEVGRLDALRRQAGHLAPQLREGGALWSLSEVRATEARARFEQGDPATSAADEAVELARDADDPLLLTAAIAAAALAHAGNSDPDAARALLTELTDVGIRNEPEYAPYLPALARAACAISAPDLIARLSAGVPDRHPFQQHALMAVRAIETELAGNHARAADLYAEAAERWHAFTSTLEEAHALLGEGRCRAHLADPAATSPLSSARALFAGMNARPRVVECDAQLARVAPATG